jgi:hypothetical protein
MKATTQTKMRGVTNMRPLLPIPQFIVEDNGAGLVGFYRHDDVYEDITGEFGTAPTQYLIDGFHVVGAIDISPDLAIFMVLGNYDGATFTVTINGTTVVFDPAIVVELHGEDHTYSTSTDLFGLVPGSYYPGDISISMEEAP